MAGDVAESSPAYFLILNDSVKGSAASIGMKKNLHDSSKKLIFVDCLEYVDGTQGVDNKYNCNGYGC